MNNCVIRRKVFVALGLFVAVTSHRAQAQTDPAAARQLFDEARTLAGERKYVEACPLFEQSYRRDPGIGTLFNLADCLQHLGRTASAWAMFRDVADEAARKNQPERERIASQRVVALLPQLPKIVVRIESKDEGLVVLRDGVAMLLSEQGKPVILDPGEHRFLARAPGKQPWETTVTVPPQGITVEVVVPNLETLEPQRSDALVANQESPQVAMLTTTPDTSKDELSTSPSSVQKYIAYAAGGVGLIGVTLGTVFGLRVMSKNDKADGVCPSGKNCSITDQTHFDEFIADAKRERTYAYLGFAVGGAALATGTVLFFTAPKTKPTALRFAPAVAVGHLGASLEGTF